MSETELLNSSSLVVTFGIISASVAIVGLPLLPVCSVIAPNIFSSLSLGNYARILIFFGQVKPGCRVLFLCISSPQMWFYHSLIFVNVMCSRELKLLLVSDA